MTYRRRADAAVLRGIIARRAGLVIGTIVLGVFASVAFDQAFELFHEIFFPGGNFAFDPTTERLVQLYPFAFWQSPLPRWGSLLLVGGSLTWWVSARVLSARKESRDRHAARHDGRPAAAAALLVGPISCWRLASLPFGLPGADPLLPGFGALLGVFGALLLFASYGVHELSHGVAARASGQQIRKSRSSASPIARR